MKTMVPGNPASASSSTSRAARSRWLVGSSMHRSAAGRPRRQQAEERRLSRAVRTHQRHTLAALDLEVDAGVDDIVAVRLVGGAKHRDPTPGARWRGEREADPARPALDLDALHAFEHLDAALHLPGLGRLVAEALDEPLDLGDALRLVPRLRLEELAARRELLEA